MTDRSFRQAGIVSRVDSGAIYCSLLAHRDTQDLTFPRPALNHCRCSETGAALDQQFNGVTVPAAPPHAAVFAFGHATVISSVAYLTA
ncbi:hypothetical protein D3C71_1918380 [compost metagenome]